VDTGKHTYPPWPPAKGAVESLSKTRFYQRWESRQTEVGPTKERIGANQQLAPSQMTNSQFSIKTACDLPHPPPTGSSSSRRIPDRRTPLRHEAIGWGIPVPTRPRNQSITVAIAIANDRFKSRTYLSAKQVFSKKGIDVTFGFCYTSYKFNENLHQHISLDLADDVCRESDA